MPMVRVSIPHRYLFDGWVCVDTYLDENCEGISIRILDLQSRNRDRV